MRALVDTNVLVRNSVPTDPDHDITKSFLAGLISRGFELCISPQCIYEFWVVATRPTMGNGLGLDSKTARRNIDLLLQAFTLLPDPPDLFDHWLELCTELSIHGKEAHDARLVAFAECHRIENLVTFNKQDFDRFKSITVLSPKALL